MSEQNQADNLKEHLEFLTFTLGVEDYGLDILKVKEIRGWEKIRELHNTPNYIKGVLDLRGKIVPIVDLRIRFNLEMAEYSPTTVIIVLTIGDNNDQMMGIVVDAVSDVLAITRDDIKKAPSLGSKINTDYVMGMVTKEDHMVMLVDSERLLDSEEFESLAEME